MSVPLGSDYSEETNFYKDHVIMWAKDLARSIDYLESRDDMDTSKLAFYGFSWGGVMDSILPAIETRIQVNVLYVAGPCCPFIRPTDISSRPAVRPRLERSRLTGLWALPMFRSASSLGSHFRS